MIITQPDHDFKRESEILHSLADAGAGFTLAGHRQKGPRQKGWNVSPHTIAEAEAHLASGGNVGILCGYPANNHLVGLDVDADFAEFLATFPQLQNTIRSIRPAAPHKGKVIVRIDGPLPPKAGYKRNDKFGALRDFDLLSTTTNGKGWNANLIGTHEAGDRIHLEGVEVVTLTPDELETIVTTWAGISAYHPPKSKRSSSSTAQLPAAPTVSGTSLVDKVKSAWTAFHIFRHHGMATRYVDEGADWRLLDHGGLLVGNPDGADASRWYNHGEEIGGHLFDAWAYCTNRDRSRDFAAILEEMATAADIDYEAEQARTQAEVRAITSDLSLWVQTTSFADFVPTTALTTIYERDDAGDYVLDDEGQRIVLRQEYHTDPTDTKVADAILDVMAKARSLRVKVTKRTLGKLAGVGPDTALRCLRDRLAGWFVHIASDETGTTVQLTDKVISRRCATSFSVFSSDKDSGSSARNDYSERKADDPYLSGTSQYMKRMVRRIVKGADIQPDPETDRSAEQVTTDMFTKRSVGETGLRILTVLIRCGEMTVDELVEETGKSKGGIYRSAKHLTDLGLITREKPAPRAKYVYDVELDVWDAIDDLRPSLRTHKLSEERENKRLYQMQLYAMRQINFTRDEDEKNALAGRVEHLGALRVPLVSSLNAHEQLTPDEIRDLAYPAGLPKMPHPAGQARLDRFHENTRMDLAEARREEQWETIRNLQTALSQLHQDSVPRGQWFDNLRLAGYTESEAARGVKAYGRAQ